MKFPYILPIFSIVTPQSRVKLIKPKPGKEKIALFRELSIRERERERGSERACKRGREITAANPLPTTGLGLNIYELEANARTTQRRPQICH